jgi:hypothetical protein
MVIVWTASWVWPVRRSWAFLGGAWAAAVAAGAVAGMRGDVAGQGIERVALVAGAVPAVAAGGIGVEVAAGQA